MRLPPRLLDVILRVEEGTEWQYELHGVGFPYRENGTLTLGRALVNAYRQTSVLLPKAADWRGEFEKFGQDMIDALCENNRQFRKDLKAGISDAGGAIANTRVTFVVHPSNYSIVLEAMFSPPDYAPEPWMIHAPLLRNVSGSPPSHANLFAADPTPLRVLIVCANTKGSVDNLPIPGGGVFTAKELKRVGAECKGLEKLFERAGKRIGIDEVHCVGLDQPLTERALTDALGKGPGWDVVHFAGHSHCETEQGAASLIVQHGDTGKPIAVDIGTIVKYLHRTRLLYMSSCRSGSASFAVTAARKGIPSVVGFRWDVDDTYAELHARLFYHRLVSEETIDQAFRSTRRAMHSYDRSNNAWASSMLVMGRA